VGEFFAFTSGWIAAEMVDIMEKAIENPLPVISFAKKAISIGQGEKVVEKAVPPRIFDLIGLPIPGEGFEVSIPGLTDIVKLGIAPIKTQEVNALERAIAQNNESIEAQVPGPIRDGLIKSRDQRLAILGGIRRRQEEAEREKQKEAIRLSPSPQSSKQRAAILTGIDNVQDDVATLAAVMHLISFLSGKALPGIGQLAFIADMLALGQAGLRITPRNARLATKGKGAIKKDIKRVAESKFGSQVNRIEEANRMGKLGIGMSDIIQGLQSLEQHTGYGLRLGPIFGAVQDLFYGFLRGATVTFAGPSWDPFNFTRVACTRSPTFDEIATGAGSVCHFAAVRIWDYGSRLLECSDCLTDLSRKRILWGLVYAMECLHPWLVGQDIEADMSNFIDQPVMGIFPRDARSEDAWNEFAPKEEWTSTHLTGDPDRVVMPRDWVRDGSVNLGAALLENIRLIEDPIEREVLENELVASSWSLMAGLNPFGRIAEQELSSSTLEDLRAFDGDPGASLRLEKLLAANAPIEKDATIA